MGEYRSFKRLLKASVRRIQGDAARIAELILPAAFLRKQAARNEGGFDAYRALGSHARISDELLKQRYYRIVREIHPDRLQALGASIGMIRKAEFVLAEINHAYETIARQRGLK